MIQIKTHDPNYFFLKIDNDLLSDYNKGFSLGKIFNVKGCGVLTQADQLLVNTKLDKLRSNIDDYVNGRSTIEVGKFTKSRGVDLNGTYKILSYKCFDNRHYYNCNLVNGPSLNLTKNESIESNYYLNFTPSVRDNNKFKHIIITKNTADAAIFAGKATNHSAPLYVINEQNKGQI